MSRFTEGKTPKHSQLPDIHWIEGVVDYYKVTPNSAGLDYGADGVDDIRDVGFLVGRQIIGQYAIEILLKYALDGQQIRYNRDHNLLELFMRLPREQRNLVEKRYAELLNSQWESAWDIQISVQAMLKYLGDNPITDSRYFWDVRHREHVMFSPEMLRPAIYAIFIELHDYPVNEPIPKRHNTVFENLENSFENSEMGDERI